MPIDVFISYKREERHLAERLQAALNNSGFIVATDADIEPNLDFVDAIQAMIDEAKATVVLWTEASAQSEWVKVEARRALKLERDPHYTNIYRGVLLEPADLPMDFETVNMLDFSKEGLTETAISEIIEHLEKELAPSAQNADDARNQTAAFSEELQAFHTADQIDDVAAYEGFVEQYPASVLAPLAHKRIQGHLRIWPRLVRKSLSYGGLAVICMVAGVLATLWVGGQSVPAPIITLEELIQLRMNLRNSETNLEALSKEKAKLETDLSARSDELNALQIQFQADQDASAIALESADAETKEIRDSLTTAQSQLSSLGAEKAELLLQLQAVQGILNEQRENHANEAGELRSRVAFLEEGLRLTQAARDRALASVEEKQRRLDDLNTENESLLSQLAIQTNEATTLKAERDRLRDLPGLNLAAFSSDHQQLINSLSLAEILEFLHSFRPGMAFCSVNGEFLPQHENLGDAGLINITDIRCNEQNSYSAVISGKGMSLANVLRDRLAASLGK